MILKLLSTINKIDRKEKLPCKSSIYMVVGKYMQTLLSNLHVGNVNFVVGILYAIIVLYETKFEEPITFFWGKPKLFKGTKKQKIYSWFVFLLTVIFFLWQV